MAAKMMTQQLHCIAHDKNRCKRWNSSCLFLQRTFNTSTINSCLLSHHAIICNYYAGRRNNTQEEHSTRRLLHSSSSSTLRRRIILRSQQQLLRIAAAVLLLFFQLKCCFFFVNIINYNDSIIQVPPPLDSYDVVVSLLLYEKILFNVVQHNNSYYSVVIVDHGTSNSFSRVVKNNLWWLNNKLLDDELSWFDTNNKVVTLVQGKRVLLSSAPPLVNTTCGSSTSGDDQVVKWTRLKNEEECKNHAMCEEEQQAVVQQEAATTLKKKTLSGILLPIASRHDNFLTKKREVASSASQREAEEDGHHHDQTSSLSVVGGIVSPPGCTTGEELSSPHNKAKSSMNKHCKYNNFVRSLSTAEDALVSTLPGASGTSMTIAQEQARITERSNSKMPSIAKVADLYVLQVSDDFSTLIATEKYYMTLPTCRHRRSSGLFGIKSKNYKRRTLSLSAAIADTTSSSVGRYDGARSNIGNDDGTSTIISPHGKMVSTSKKELPAAAHHHQYDNHAGITSSASSLSLLYTDAFQLVLDEDLSEAINRRRRISKSPLASRSSSKSTNCTNNYENDDPPMSPSCRNTGSSNIICAALGTATNHIFKSSTWRNTCSPQYGTFSSSSSSAGAMNTSSTMSNTIHTRTEERSLVTSGANDTLVPRSNHASAHQEQDQKKPLSPLTLGTRLVAKDESQIRIAELPRSSSGESGSPSSDIAHKTVNDDGEGNKESSSSPPTVEPFSPIAHHSIKKTRSLDVTERNSFFRQISFSDILDEGDWGSGLSKIDLNPLKHTLVQLQSAAAAPLILTPPIVSTEGGTNGGCATRTTSTTLTNNNKPSPRNGCNNRNKQQRYVKIVWPSKGPTTMLELEKFIGLCVIGPVLHARGRSAKSFGIDETSALDKLELTRVKFQFHFGFWPLPRRRESDEGSKSKRKPSTAGTSTPTNSSSSLMNNLVKESTDDTDWLGHILGQALYRRYRRSGLFSTALSQMPANKFWAIDDDEDKELFGQPHSGGINGFGGNKSQSQKNQEIVPVLVDEEEPDAEVFPQDEYSSSSANADSTTTEKTKRSASNASTATTNSSAFDGPHVNPKILKSCSTPQHYKGATTTTMNDNITTPRSSDDTICASIIDEEEEDDDSSSSFYSTMVIANIARLFGSKYIARRRTQEIQMSSSSEVVVDGVETKNDSASDLGSKKCYDYSTSSSCNHANIGPTVIGKKDTTSNASLLNDHTDNKMKATNNNKSAGAVEESCLLREYWGVSELPWEFPLQFIWELQIRNGCDAEGVTRTEPKITLRVFPLPMQGPIAKLFLRRSSRPHQITTNGTTRNNNLEDVAVTSTNPGLRSHDSTTKFDSYTYCTTNKSNNFMEEAEERLSPTASISSPISTSPTSPPLLLHPSSSQRTSRRKSNHQNIEIFEVLEPHPSLYSSDDDLPRHHNDYVVDHDPTSSASPTREPTGKKSLYPNFLRIRSALDTRSLAPFKYTGSHPHATSCRDHLFRNIFGKPFGPYFSGTSDRPQFNCGSALDDEFDSNASTWYYYRNRGDPPPPYMMECGDNRSNRNTHGSHSPPRRRNSGRVALYATFIFQLIQTYFISCFWHMICSASSSRTSSRPATEVSAASSSSPGSRSSSSSRRRQQTLPAAIVLASSSSSPETEPHTITMRSSTTSNYGTSTSSLPTEQHWHSTTPSSTPTGRRNDKKNRTGKKKSKKDRTPQHQMSFSNSTSNMSHDIHSASAPAIIATDKGTNNMNVSTKSTSNSSKRSLSQEGLSEENHDQSNTTNLLVQKQQEATIINGKFVLLSSSSPLIANSYVEDHTSGSQTTPASRDASLIIIQQQQPNSTISTTNRSSSLSDSHGVPLPHRRDSHNTSSGGASSSSSSATTSHHQTPMLVPTLFKTPSVVVGSSVNKEDHNTTEEIDRDTGNNIIAANEIINSSSTTIMDANATTTNKVERCKSPKPPMTEDNIPKKLTTSAANKLLDHDDNTAPAEKEDLLLQHTSQCFYNTAALGNDDDSDTSSSSKSANTSRRSCEEEIDAIGDKEEDNFPFSTRQRKQSRKVPFCKMQYTTGILTRHLTDYMTSNWRDCITHQSLALPAAIGRRK